MYISQWFYWTKLLTILLPVAAVTTEKQFLNFITTGFGNDRTSSFSPQNRDISGHWHHCFTFCNWENNVAADQNNLQLDQEVLVVHLGLADPADPRAQKCKLISDERTEVLRSQMKTTPLSVTMRKICVVQFSWKTHSNKLTGFPSKPLLPGWPLFPWYDE